jgi:hypothetical protein
MELISKEPRLMCEVEISPNIFVHVLELGLECSIPSSFGGTGTNCCTFGGSNSKSYIYSSIFFWA